MYRLIALLLIFVPSSLVHATAITDLPGFVGFSLCFVFSPSATLCEGTTKQELLTQNFSFDFRLQPVPIRGGLGNENGELGKGNEFLVLYMPQGAMLDSVALYLGSPTPSSAEYANSVTTPGALFAPGFSANDLPKTLGPTDRNYVELQHGTLIYGFASSAPVITPLPEPLPEPAPESPVPVPEPATLTLLAVGSVALKVATHKGRKFRT
jgi:hypothetical protein